MSSSIPSGCNHAPAWQPWRRDPRAATPRAGQNRRRGRRSARHRGPTFARMLNGRLSHRQPVTTRHLHDCDDAKEYDDRDGNPLGHAARSSHISHDEPDQVAVSSIPYRFPVRLAIASYERMGAWSETCNSRTSPSTIARSRARPRQSVREGHRDSRSPRRLVDLDLALAMMREKRDV